MKLKTLTSAVLLIASSVASFASVWSVSSPHQTSAYSTAITPGVTISDGRQIVIGGVQYCVKSTSGYFTVTSAYYSTGNLNVIDLSNFHPSPGAGYSFESAGGGNTSTTLSGNSADFTISRNYSAYLDDDAGMTFAQYGCLVLLPANSDYLYAYNYKWVDIGFQVNNGKWISNSGGSGSALYGTASSKGTTEIFHACSDGGTALERTAGRLESGDNISLLAYGPFWVSAEAGSLVYVIANRANAYGWEHSTITKTSGSGTISNGTTVSMLSHAIAPKYWCAESGGNDVINANRTSVGAYETFTISR